MVITFNSPQDRFGLQAAGSILADAMLRNSQEELRNRRLIEQDQRQQGFLQQQEQRRLGLLQSQEDRQRALARDAGTVLSEVLSSNSLDQLLENPSVLYEAIKNNPNVDPGSVLEQFNNIATLRSNQLRSIPRPERTQPSTFRKEIDKSLAQTVMNAPKVYSMGGTISRLRELSEGLKGLTGFGKSAVNSEEAAEFNALGLTLLDAPIKIFNPVGAIPTQKIELLKDKFAPKSYDLQGTIEGKLRAAERLQKAAEDKVIRLQGLVEEYGSFDSIPDKELLHYSQEAERELDKLIAEPIRASSSDSVFSKLPSPSKYDGKRVRDVDTGKVYMSDGKRWKLVR